VKINRAVLSAAIAAWLPITGMAQEPAVPSSNEALRQEIDEQKQRLAVLERKLELQDEAAKAAAASAPRITASASRFQVGSTNNENFLRFRGTLHADNRVFSGDSVPETADTFILRRVRPTLEGTFGGLYDFRFMPDFAGGRTTIVDAYIAARFDPRATVTVGKFKAPVGPSACKARRTSASSNAPCPPRWCPIAISACSSRASSVVACSPTRWATSMASTTASRATTSPRPTSKSTPRATTPRACSSSRS
jgi:hypothetical protein